MTPDQRIAELEAALSERRAQFETTQRQLEDTSVELLRVRACCAEMRECISGAGPFCTNSSAWLKQREHALSSNAGQPILEKLRVMEEAFPYPELTRSNCDALRFHFSQDEPFGGIGKDALLAWLDSVSKGLEALETAKNL